MVGNRYQIECDVDGSREPTPDGHKSLRFAVPHKCHRCRHNFEGQCRIITNRLVRLDYGFCGIEGSQELVDHPDAGRKIPAKCASCEYLAQHDVYKLVCSKDSDVWGDVPRGLDY